ISQSLLGDFCNTIGTKRTYRGKRSRSAFGAKRTWTASVADDPQAVIRGLVHDFATAQSQSATIYVWTVIREDKMRRRRHRNATALRRRDILAGVGSLAAGAAFPAPAIAQGNRQLKMVTDWPAGSPGLQSSAARLAQRISTAS